MLIEGWNWCGRVQVNLKITILAISELNMELGTFYLVFTRFWGFDPLTWNIKRKFMLKARFEMVHVNQNKIRILRWLDLQFGLPSKIPFSPI